jgi:hypothetical protein
VPLATPRSASLLRLLLTIGMVPSLCSIGCAQVIAFRQPRPLDRSVLHEGAERDLIVATLGYPVAQDRPPGTTPPRLRETYVYTDGGTVNSAGGKTARIVLYTVGDLFTVFLTQIIWLPAELLCEGTQYHASVEYHRRPMDQTWVVQWLRERKLKE